MIDNSIFISMISMLGLGITFATLLSAAHLKLKVKEDPQIEAVEAALPGIDCGTCGYSGCHDFAVNVVSGEASIDGCVPGGQDVAIEIAEIMGMELSTGGAKRKAAVVHCGAVDEIKKRLGNYQGINSCRSAEISLGGHLECGFGCLGFGDCERVCPYDAIQMEKGLPIIDIDRCTACGECVRVCPRGIISIEKFKKGVDSLKVACSSQATGAETKKVCSVGCIACGLCEKKAPDGVFSVQENLSQVNYSQLDDNTDFFDDIIALCPTNCIKRVSCKEVNRDA